MQTNQKGKKDLDPFNEVVKMRSTSSGELDEVLSNGNT
jgi:hypothetical protein